MAVLNSMAALEASTGSPHQCCDECEEEDPELLCEHCEKFFCRVCDIRVHAKGDRRDHERSYLDRNFSLDYGPSSLPPKRAPAPLKSVTRLDLVKALGACITIERTQVAEESDTSVPEIVSPSDDSPYCNLPPRSSPKANIPLLTALVPQSHSRPSVVSGSHSSHNNSVINPASLLGALRQKVAQELSSPRTGSDTALASPRTRQLRTWIGQIRELEAERDRLAKVVIAHERRIGELEEEVAFSRDVEDECAKLRAQLVESKKQLESKCSSSSGEKKLQQENAMLQQEVQRLQMALQAKIVAEGSSSGIQQARLEQMWAVQMLQLRRVHGSVAQRWKQNMHKWDAPGESVQSENHNPVGPAKSEISLGLAEAATGKLTTQPLFPLPIQLALAPGSAFISGSVA